MNELAPFREELRFVLRHPGVRFVLLGLGVGGASLLFFITVFWWPAHSREIRLEKRMENLRYRVAAGDQARKAVRLIRAAKKDLEEAKKRLDSGSKQAELVNRSFSLAKGKGLTVLGQSNRSRKLNKKYELFLQELSLKGSYEAFRGFFAALPRFPTWTVVREVRMERLGRGGKGIEATVTLGTLRGTQDSSPESGR